MISLTDEQRDAVSYPDNLNLSACPGSGKTRVIIAKLLKLAEDTIGTTRSIGCITYTNTAVDEIELRLRKYGSEGLLRRCEVATIHSFCLQFILRPYNWLIPEIPKQFRIITRQTRDFERIVGAVVDELNREPTFQTYDHYDSIRLDIHGNPQGTGIQNGLVTEASARRFWELCLLNGFLDFSMILYYSMRILSEHAFVSRGLGAHFSWLLIDEFQDTTDVQIKILDLLAANSLTNFFMVGDSIQAIQGFAGADLQFSEAFAGSINANPDLSLSGNFRSSTNIVALAERTISRAPNMEAVGVNSDYELDVQYEHCNTAVEAITDHFMPLLEEHKIDLGNAAILAPWWQHLVPVARRLREFDVPVFGPGARPYKRARLYAVLAEQLGACVSSGNLLSLPGIERAIFRLVSEVTGASRFDIFSYNGRRSALATAYEAQKTARENLGGAAWLRASSDAVASVLIQDEWLPPNAHGLLVRSVEEMISDMERGNVDVDNLQISDLGLFADPENALKLITLHRAKGREFDAVAMIHMNHGQIPHFANQSAAAIDEARRLFYVGATRAKKVLLLASNDDNFGNPPTRYLRECGLI